MEYMQRKRNAIMAKTRRKAQRDGLSADDARKALETAASKLDRSEAFHAGLLHKQQKSRHDAEKRFFQRLKATYGLTQADFLHMLVGQASKCAVCQRELVLFSSDRKEAPVVDHDHSTGKVRGLLCLGCNTRVGRAEYSADRADAQAKQFVAGHKTEI